MENISKAMIMIGSVLIAIMIATFFILMLRQGGKMNAEYDTSLADNEIVKFNSQFEAYGKEDNTFFDVITAINLAYDTNKKNGYDSENGIEIHIYNEAGTKIEYSLLNDSSTEKNKLFVGSDTTKGQIYIYGEDKIGVTTYNLMNDYGKEIEVTNAEGEISKVLPTFSCVGNSIKYNDLSGKVKEMNFTVKMP